jgi:RNA polymerase sigma factor (sigma-70 family)
MGNGLNGSALLQVARVFRDGSLVGMSDQEILERFVESRDEMAFEAILTRHGPMVRRVCQQMLFNTHDVDDAVQAVFLALVRKAKTIRIEDSLGPWLYTVAGRVAARARSKRRKRWARESFKAIPPEPSYSSTAGNSEIPGIIHDELGRLPERLRAPLVLCYLKGLTHDVAARQLDCPVGTVRSRLARARDLLHTRITRRGLTLTAAAVAGALESNAAATTSSHLPASLVRSITASAVQMLPRNGMGLSSSFAMILEGVLNVLPVKKVAVLATAISVGTIAFAVVERTTVGQTPPPKSQASQSPDGPRPHDLPGEQISVLPQLETKKDPYVLAIEAKLNEKVSVHIDKQPLGEAVSYLQNYSGVNIVLDPKALSEEGVTSSSPVSLTAEQVPMKSVLKLLLRPLGLTFKIEDEVVLITSPQAVLPQTYPKSYYVGDLVNPKPFGLTPLTELIEASVAPGTWMVHDGYGNQVPSKKNSRGTVPQDQRNAMVPFFLTVSLIVRCSAETHDEIASLLRCLRRLKKTWDDPNESSERPFPRRTQSTDGQNAAVPEAPASAERRDKIDQPINAPLGAPAASGGDSEINAGGNNRSGVATMPDVDVTVSETKRVISPQGTTTFEIRLANFGTREATNLTLAAELSPNLEFQALERGPNGVNVAINEKKDTITFERIATLAPAKVMVFAIKVKALSAKPRLATCKATVAHDGQAEPLGDMACVKVMTRMSSEVAQQREPSGNSD